MATNKITEEEEQSDDDKLKKIAMNMGRVDPGGTFGVDPKTWKKLVSGWREQGRLLLRIASASKPAKGKSKSKPKGAG